MVVLLTKLQILVAVSVSRHKGSSIIIPEYRQIFGYPTSFEYLLFHEYLLCFGNETNFEYLFLSLGIC